MISITEKEIDKAADDFAKEDLGTVQYLSNPDAVHAIRETFKAGCLFIMAYANTKNTSDKN